MFTYFHLYLFVYLSLLYFIRRTRVACAYAEADGWDSGFAVWCGVSAIENVLIEVYIHFRLCVIVA